MAKSPSERIQEPHTQVELLCDHDTNRADEIGILRDEVRELKGELKSEREVRHKLEVELTDLKRQFQDHLAQYQEWDKRKWAIFGIVIGAACALASNLIVSLSRK